MSRGSRLSSCFVSAAIVVGGIGLGGCQAGRTYVLSTSEITPVATSLSIQETRSGVSTIQDEQKSRFERTLRDRLGPIAVSSGADVSIDYRFVLHDEGSGAARVGATIINLVGVPTGSLGNGTLAVEAVFRDRSGREVARILADGPIDGPFGSTEGGLDTAAESIATFAKTLFPTGMPAGSLASRSVN